MQIRRAILVVSIAATSEGWLPSARAQLAEPTAVAPRPPARLRQIPRPPFQLELQWESMDERAAGFVVEGFNKYRGWVRTALINPVHTSYVYKGTHVGEVCRFRVRSFNRAGVSAPSNEVRLVAGTAVRPQSTQRPDDFHPCDPPDSRDPTVQSGSSGGETGGVRRKKIKVGKHLFLVRSDPDCLSSNCDDSVSMWVRKCFRPVGSINNAYLGLGGDFYLGEDRAGWPVLLESSHASAFEAGFSILQLVDGEYRKVDRWQGCSEFRDDPLTAAMPPFRECQQEDLW
ncbi:MAG: fibronectin type III domain-containing protein [Deltaproteobacteria bacterium]|nr:fibronectin type III domain-containing protein [Deltaproteobacteria bacterium]